MSRTAVVFHATTLCGVDAAVLKPCCVDLRVGADVSAVFAAHRRTLHAPQEDVPDVAFLAVTVPLTTERGPSGRVTMSRGRGDHLGPEHNVVREQCNSMVRAVYATTERCVVIPSVQFTSGDGNRVAGRHDGDLDHPLDEACATDPGHLNPDGAPLAASAMAAVLAGPVCLR